MKLEKVEIGGIRGKALTSNINKVYEEFRVSKYKYRYKYKYGSLAGDSQWGVLNEFSLSTSTAVTKTADRSRICVQTYDLYLRHLSVSGF